ncbi:MAG: beta-hydroxyacyl-ACP dehydratase [Williamsia sp.]|nr:beta-hydroxyacyl-ACP dehydratase [Williamsia sp.]
MTTEAHTLDEIVEMIPHREPFRFIDKITYIDDDSVEGNYFLHAGHAFYEGHFPGHPLTPGVILIEVMAQIGLVAFGLYLLNKTEPLHQLIGTGLPVLTSVDIKFSKKVLPGEQVFVRAEKTLFRHGRLICKVKLKNSQGGTAAEGSISGFIAAKN